VDTYRAQLNMPFSKMCRLYAAANMRSFSIQYLFSDKIDIHCCAKR